VVVEDGVFLSHEVDLGEETVEVLVDLVVFGYVLFVGGVQLVCGDSLKSGVSVAPQGLFGCGCFGLLDVVDVLFEDGSGDEWE
jgi:hypothetical protein